VPRHPLRSVGFVLLLLAAATAAAAQAERLPGSYVGLAEAQGMKLVLREARGRIEGTFTDSNGVTAPIRAENLGTAAEAMLEFPARKVKVRLFPEAIGVRMIAIPLDAEGNPILEQTNAFVFVPAGTKVPALPAGYQNPPAQATVVDPDVFLISYEFWPPEGVALGWESIEDRYRPVIGLFPVVLTDVLWKLCASSYKPPELGEALRGQGVTCARILARIDEVQAKGRFDKYKALVAKERAVLLAAVNCARGAVVTPAVCQPAAKRVAEAAVSLNTVAAVLGKL
jgi:hypothetical protein